MARYHRVSPTYWSESASWPERDRYLGIYLQTCEHRNLEGLYRLPKAYIAADLNWTPRIASQSLGRLLDIGWCFYDAKAEVILLPNVLAIQAPSTSLQMKGAIAALKRVPANSLWNRFLIACQSHCPSLYEAIADEFGIAPESNGNIARTRNSNSGSNSGVRT